MTGKAFMIMNIFNILQFPFVEVQIPEFCSDIKYLEGYELWTK